MDTNSLVTDNLDLIDIAINSTVFRYHHELTDAEREDLYSEVAENLVKVAKRWPSYAKEKGADILDMNHFRVFATKRLKGSVIDYWRKESPLTRQEIDLSTYAAKHSIEESAEKYGASVRAVKQAIQRRQELLTHADIQDVKLTVGPTVSTWEELGTTVKNMPLAAQMWITLVYVGGLSTKQAANLMGISRGDATRRVRAYVEHALIKAYLQAV